MKNLSVIQLVCKDVWIVICCLEILYVASAFTNIELICSLLFLTVTVIICEESSNKEAKFRTISLMAVEGYLILNMFPIELREIDIFVNLLLMIVIYSLFKKEIKNYFAEVRNADEQLRTNKINDQKYKVEKGKAYMQIVIGISAAVVLIVHWLFGITNVTKIRIQTGTVYVPKELSEIVLLISGLMLLFGLNQIRKYAVIKVLTFFFSAFLFIMLIVAVIVNIEMSLILAWPWYKRIMAAFSIFACIGTGILSAHGYYMNMVWLRGLEKKIFAAIMAFVQLIGGILLTLTLTILILCQQSKSSMLLIGTATIYGFVIIPLLHALVFRYEHKEYHVVGNSPLGGIAQDGLMICMIVFFVICMPCLYISLSAKGMVAWIVAGSLVSTVFPPVGYCLRNNQKHIKACRKVLIKYPNEEELWSVLRKCLVRQSEQTVFSTMPYVVIAMAFAYGNRMMKSMERREILGDIFHTYIDADDYDKEEESSEEDD